MRKVLISGMIGNGLEWYDYALYGHMAFILGKLFFPGEDEAMKLLLAYGTFAAGFFARPVGAILFGYIGDKYGRKVALAIAILLMAIPTGCIGLLPTYEQIGIWAPILLTLIRICQGLSLGGEFSGAIIYIVEHSPNNKRGWLGSMSLVSLILGFLLGSFISAGFAHFLSTEDFESWGWRIPFLFGVVVGLVGFYIRSHCEESPYYEEAKKEGHLSDKPVREALFSYPGTMLKAFGVYMCVTMPFYLLSIYFTSFTHLQLGRSISEAFTINMMSLSAMMLTLLFSARLSDRIGRKKVMVTGAALLLLLAYPAFMILHIPNFWAIAGAQILLSLCLGFYFAPVPAMLVEMFPTRIRYTGMALSYNLCAALIGGTTPMVSEWLIGVTGSSYSIAYYVMICATAALTALYSYRDRWRESLASPIVVL